jgi:hypothetical protein
MKTLIRRETVLLLSEMGDSQATNLLINEARFVRDGKFVDFQFAAENGEVVVAGHLGLNAFPHEKTRSQS